MYIIIFLDSPSLKNQIVIAYVKLAVLIAKCRDLIQNTDFFLSIGYKNLEYIHFYTSI